MRQVLLWSVVRFLASNAKSRCQFCPVSPRHEKVINSVIDIVENLVTGISIVTSPFSTMFSAISIILTYFGMKDLFGVEENESFIKKYAIIKLVAAFAFVILSRIGIY